ncbi:MAG TPA: hypothetical protein VLL54_01570 [Pyrinomonadaceae bacterium]|nr:hypothetical protein [Pyrinomonadaceae bacterium]
MDQKRSKYDTNPLDPDYVKNTDEVWTPGEDFPSTQEVKRATREVADSANEEARRNIYSEAPTRRYDNVSPDAPYPSVFVPPTHSPPPAPYQPPREPYQPVTQRPTHRSVAGIGLPERWAMMLPYAPYIGVVVCILELFLVPRREPRIRFHAAQGLALHIAILVVQTLFNLVGAITGSSVGGKLFGVLATVFLVISMVRVWKGEPHFIAPIAEPAGWLNQHIEPRNK